MKFVEGGQLDEVVKHTPMSIRQAVELVIKVARTVHYAHEHGILHRDIKPGNILLDKQGQPHLTDFGLARLVESESTVTRTVEVLVHRVIWRLNKQPAITVKLTMEQMCMDWCGALPAANWASSFCGRNNLRNDQVTAGNRPRSPRLWNPKVDRDLSTVCLKCLEKDPERRYFSALALRRTWNTG